jgi:hypothetical protein
VETIPHSPAALDIRGQVGRNASEISIHHRLSYRNSRDTKTGQKIWISSSAESGTCSVELHTDGTKRKEITRVGGAVSGMS